MDQRFLYEKYTVAAGRRNRIDALYAAVIMRSMRSRPISQFERYAQRLVEGALARLWGDRVFAVEIAAHLARALEDSQRGG